MENRPTTILLIEDNPGDARLIREMLRENRNAKYEVLWAARLEDGLTRLAEQHIDVILLDLILPDSRGIETFQSVREKISGVPIIILTGLDDESIALQALREGGQDYLVKGVLESDLLQRAIRYAIERNQAEKALRESEEFSTGLLNNSPNPIIVINEDTSVRFINPAFERLTGFSYAETIGIKAPYPWWPEEKRHEIRKDLEKSMQEGIRRLKKIFIKKDSERFWVEITSRAVQRDGTFKYYIAVWIDVTDIIRAEEELRKHRDQLEELVQERTVELSNANIKLREEIAERKKTGEALKKREQELEEKSHYLEEANTALKVLLKHREEDKSELQENVLSNVRELIMPYIEKLKMARNNSAEQGAYISVIETNLNNIISPFLRNVTLNHYNLTPKEIQVAHLVKEGKTTKDIAELLHISTRAVEFHRDNIRNKLGLKNKKSNLRSTLLSLQ